MSVVNFYDSMGLSIVRVGTQYAFYCVTMEATLPNSPPLIVFSEPWVYRTAAMIIVMNLLDGMLTLGVIHVGAATEANPLMEHTLAAFGAVGFMSIKCVLVSLGVLLLWRLRDRWLAVTSLCGLAGVYSLLILYHMYSIDAITRFVFGMSLLT